MDPLSISASAIGITTAILQVLRCIQSATTASSDVRRVLDDIKSIETTLIMIKSIWESTRISCSIPTQVKDHSTLILQEAFTKLTELHDLLNDKIVWTEQSSQQTKIRRHGWLIYKAKVESLRKDLISCRISLIAMVDIMSFSKLSALQATIDQHITNFDARTTHDEPMKDLDRICSLLRHTSTVSQTVLSFRPDPGTTCGARTDPRPRGDPVPASVPIARYMHDPEVSMSSFKSQKETSLISDTQKLITSANSGRHVSMMSTAENGAANSEVCSPWCSCDCHRRSSIQMPKTLADIFGYFSIGISGPLFEQRKCSERRCHSSSSTMLRLFFSLPTWFRMQGYRAILAYGGPKGLDLRLRSQTIIDGRSQVFTLAIQGDVDGIKVLFAKRLANVFDISASNGRTALAYAVNYDRKDMVRFLLEQGADPLVEDRDLNSATAIAWNRILRRQIPQETVQEWMLAFPCEELLDAMTLGPLHKVVLGLKGAHLETLLDLSTAAIDDRDSQGLTALSWAAARCDLETLQLLLSYGASPNVNSSAGTSPLQFAAQSHQPNVEPVLQALIRAGAKTWHIDNFGRTALIYGSCNQDDPSRLYPLLERCSDSQVNHRDCWRRTSLGYAAKMGFENTVKKLLESGADPTICDDGGLMPLFETIELHHYGCAEVLSRTRSAVLAQNFAGESVLHAAARFGDQGTLQLLASSPLLKGQQEMWCDNNGKTALEVFQTRLDITEDLASLWSSLERHVMSPG